MKIYGTQIPPNLISLTDVENVLNQKFNFNECDFNVYNDLNFSDLYFYFNEKLKHSNIKFFISNEVIKDSNVFDFDLYYDLHHKRDILIDRSFLFYVGTSSLRNLKLIDNLICEIFNCRNLSFGYLDEVSPLQL